MGLLVTPTPITIFKKVESGVDPWGVPTFVEESVEAKARVKAEYGSTTLTPEGTESQDTKIDTTFSFNGFVNVAVGDRLEYINDYGSKVVSNASGVSFIKDFGGKILLTKVVA